jgi:hypothetical protein
MKCAVSKLVVGCPKIECPNLKEREGRLNDCNDEGFRVP